MSIIARLSSEIAYFRGAMRALQRSSSVIKNPHLTLRDKIESVAARYPDNIALVSDGESLTYAEMNGRSNRYARWAMAQGLGKGDAIALLMPNRAEYLCAWFGFAKAGCITALLNTNLAGKSLAYCIDIAQARLILVDASLLPAFETARGLISGACQVFACGPGGGPDPLLDLAACSGDNLAEGERVALTIADRAVYVYTSGTTGLPKAANINHSRVLRIMEGFSGATGATAADRMYVSMPLYHSTGGLCATGAVLTVGGTCVIREKFSASQFWNDIIAHQCTMFVYVGELCRYLLAAPPKPTDKAHHLRLCFGNGLRPEIFTAFRDRFGLSHILEFYGATEGNISLFNFDSKPGSVGRIPKWAEKKYCVKIIAFDIETGQPVRGPDGFCIECQNGETGEIIAQILDDPDRPTNKFDGYADKAATEKKILRDGFAKGDAWFRSGDLMKRDALGYFYFQDRIGDTFRWKGENVSTGEVAAVLGSFPGVNDVNVYGVAVPGLEGRAGMAALALDDPEHFDLAALRTYLATHLPDYARPLFLRIQHQIELTSTFKQRKVELVRDGFDPAAIADPLYFSDPAGPGFQVLTPAVFAQIAAGQIRL